MSPLTVERNDPASRLSINISSTTFSMEEPPSPYEDTPPEYETLVSSPQLLKKFNIQPREDEGHEKLPAYSCALSLENVFLRKLELEGAVHRAHDRNWYRVYATLQGTALSFHKYKGKGMFGKSEVSKYEEDPDFPSGSRRGTPIKSYNLRHAEVGIAADYYKRKYVIRIRAEADQFLLSCIKIETFVQWLQCLFMALDLAPPLEDRQVPQDISIPRSRRRSPCIRFTGEGTGNIDVEGNAELIREQYEIIRRYYPGLNSDSNLPNVTVTATDANVLQDTITGLAAVGFLEDPSARHPTQRSTSVPNVPTLRESAPPLTRANTAPENPSIDSETGKWRPVHRWTALYDLIYAKRCMAILASNSPRKSKFVMIKGKEWIVDWATGNLTGTGPPEYGEIDRPVSSGRSGDTFRVGQYGSLVRL